jgi:predicted N-acetyltransferase YhbS
LGGLVLFDIPPGTIVHLMARISQCEKWVDFTSSSKPVFVKTGRLSPAQKQGIQNLQAECFGHISQKEIRECFFAKGFGRILVYDGNVIVGQAELFSRPIYFQGMKILLGGVAGTCVTWSQQHRGIGKAIVRHGLSRLRERKCDIACLNVNVRKYPRGGLYYSLGFRVMKRRVSFEDVHGRVRYDTGEMFLPICSQAIYDMVMTSEKIFHIGRGYW